MTMPRVHTASTNVDSLVSTARFVVSADGLGEISFSELTGITSEVEVSEYMASNKMGVSLSKQFGRTKPAEVTLKRGVDQNLKLWEWHQKVLAGDPTARRSCTLTLLDSAGVIKQAYNLLNAWPAKLEISGMKAGASDNAVATVKLVCEQIDVTAR
jgi:phage tail-like protein